MGALSSIRFSMRSFTCVQPPGCMIPGAKANSQLFSCALFSFWLAARGWRLGLAAPGCGVGGVLLLFFLDFLLGQERLEAAAATRLVHSSRAHHDKLVRRHETLRVHRRIPAAHADGEQLRDFFRYGEEARYGLEGAPHEVGVEPCDNHALAQVGELRARVDHGVAEKLRFVDSDDFRARRNLVQNLPSRLNELGGDFEPRMRNDSVLCEALVDRGLEDLHALLPDFGPSQRTESFRIRGSKSPPS